MKPKYEINPAHLPGKSGKPTNPKKDLLPNDAQQVFKTCIPNAKNLIGSGPFKGQPKHWWGKNSKGEYYRYSHGNNGKAHYSGTFRKDDKRVPSDIRGRLENSGSVGGGPRTPPGFTNGTPDFVI